MRNFSTKRLAHICFVLLLVNLSVSLLFFYTNDVGVENLDGTMVEPHSRELLLKLVSGQVFSFPLLSLLIGSITALFIERDQPYKKRYWKGFFLTLSSIYAALAIAGLLRSIIFIFT